LGRYFYPGQLPKDESFWCRLQVRFAKVCFANGESELVSGGLQAFNREFMLCPSKSGGFTSLSHTQSPSMQTLLFAFSLKKLSLKIATLFCWVLLRNSAAKASPQ